MPAEETTADFGDYVRILKRRKKQLFIPGVVVVALSVALAFGLPPSYKSEATLLIERQTIPVNLVESTVTGYVQERIEQITQKILTYNNLLEIAKKHNLYADQIDKDPRTAAQQVKDDFEVEMVDVKAADPNVVGTREATIAFTVSFEANSAELAQTITQELAERYLFEHESQRQTQAKEVLAFLEEETTKLEAEIDEMEAQFADFKQAELHTLPELMSVNLKLFEKTEAEIDQSQERIRELEEEITTTRAEMSVTPLYDKVQDDEGNTVQTGENRLNSLIAQYMRATARYSQKHPDVRRLSREIRVLAEQTGSSGRADELMSELINVQEQLRQAQQTYGPGHPTVAQLERSVAALQRGFQSALTSSTTQTQSRAPAPTNRAYVALKSQLDGATASLQAERNKLARREQKLAEYEARLYETPIVESEYENLRRDLANAVAKYNDLKNKQIDSRLAQELEAGESGEKFSLSSPAFKPSLPDSPNRIGILLLGILLAGITSLGFVAMAEFLDKAVYDARTVAATLGAPPLAVIPKIA